MNKKLDNIRRHGTTVEKKILLHSIPGASVSILDEDFLYPN
jgi:hypothetical protein